MMYHFCFVVSGFDINKLCKEAQTRWLKPFEVLFILQNYESFQLTHKPPVKPPGNIHALLGY